MPELLLSVNLVLDGRPLLIEVADPEEAGVFLRIGDYHLNCIILNHPHISIRRLLSYRTSPSIYMIILGTPGCPPE